MDSQPTFDRITARHLETGELDSFSVIHRFELEGRTCLVVSEEKDVLQALDAGDLPKVYGFMEVEDQLLPLTGEDLGARLARASIGKDARIAVAHLPPDPGPVRFEAEELVSFDGEDANGALVALFNLTDDQDVRAAIRLDGTPDGTVYLPCPASLVPEAQPILRMVAFRRRILRTL